MIKYTENIVNLLKFTLNGTAITTQYIIKNKAVLLYVLTDLIDHLQQS